MSRAEEMLPSRRYAEKNKRNNYSHGSKWKDEKGEEYMDDHVNGVDWHIPNKSK